MNRFSSLTAPPRDLGRKGLIIQIFTVSLDIQRVIYADPKSNVMKAERNSSRIAGFRRRLSRGTWFFPGLCRGLSRFGRGFNHRRRFQLGLFRSAMVAMVQRLDARGFCFHPQLSVAVFLTLVF
jgi:hypothetical protein